MYLDSGNEYSVQHMNIEENSEQNYQNAKALLGPNREGVSGKQYRTTWLKDLLAGRQNISKQMEQKGVSIQGANPSKKLVPSQSP